MVIIMGKARIFFLIIITSILLSGCVTTEKKLMEEGNKPLTQNQLESLFSQTRTINWKSAKGSTGTSIIRPDHTSEWKWSGGSGAGKWEIRGNRYCVIPNDGNESCRTVFKTGDKEYTLFESGSFKVRYTFNE